MHNFKDFGITPSTKGFTGDKIKISKILNLEIIIHDYKLADSKYSGRRLDIQIELNGTKHITWTGSSYMIEMIERVPKDKFPFKATIVEDNDRYILV